MLKLEGEVTQVLMAVVLIHMVLDHLLIMVQVLIQLLIVQRQHQVKL